MKIGVANLNLAAPILYNFRLGWMTQKVFASKFYIYRVAFSNRISQN